MLLAENCKGEVRMCLRQILILAHAVAEPHAENTARADGRERLYHLIPRVARVRPRVKPDLDALHAVGLQHPDGKRCREPHRHNAPPITGGNEEHESHQYGYAEYDACRPEIRLTINEKRHHENRAKRHDNARPVEVHAESFLAEHRRDRERSHQYAHEFRELRRLKTQRAERKPALCAIHRRPDKEDGKEKKKRRAESNEHQTAQTLIVHPAADPTGDYAEQHPHQVPLEEIVRILELHRRKHIA